MLRRIIVPVVVASVAAAGFGSFFTAAHAQEAASKKESIHRYLLDIYTKQRKFSEAGVEYGALLAMKGTDPVLRYNYGLFLTHQTKYGPARDQLRQATKLDPSNGDYHGALGQILVQLKDYPGATKELAMAIQLGKGEYKKDYDNIQKYQQSVDKQKAYAQEMKKYSEQKKKVAPTSSTDDDEE